MDATSDQVFVSMGSPFCDFLWLHLDSAAEDFYIQFHENTPAFALALFRQNAWRRGYEQDSGSDPYDTEVFMGEGIWRIYLADREVVSDFDKWEETLPDLTPTGYGPHSGFMEAVTT